MKQLLKIVLFILLILQFNQAYVENTTTLYGTYTEKAILIEKYLVSHKSKIEKFSKKYFLGNNKEIKTNINRIDYLIKNLNKFKNNTISDSDSKIVILTILKEIKVVNENLKNILSKEKHNFENKLNKKKQVYGELGARLSIELNKINIAFGTKYIKDIEKLNQKEKNIKNAIIELNRESKRLKYFGNFKFNSEKELKQAFLRILRDIKSQMIIIKKNIKKD